MNMSTYFKTQKLKFSFAVKNGATPKSEIAEYWGGNILWITPADFSTNQCYIIEARRTITEKGLDSCGTNLVSAGSVIVSNRAPIGLIGIAAQDLCTSQGCKSLVKKKYVVNEKFVYYYLATQEKALNTLGRGTTFFELSTYDLANFYIPMPPDDVQTIIVAYLDHRTTEIDKLLTNLQSQSDLLDRYKWELITEAVTHGIDKTVMCRNSGVDWIGKIPKHWKLTKTKWMFEIVKRLYDKEDRDVLSITQRGLKVKDIESNDGQLAESYIGYQVVNINDFAMNSMDLLTGWIDCSPFEGVTSPDYRVFRFHQSKPQCYSYYKYLFQMCYTNRIFYRLGQGVSNLGRWRLQADQFLNMKLPQPPIEEQEKIAAYLDKKTAQVDNLITDINHQIVKLRQYRQIVIHDAVTGKIKVKETQDNGN